MKYRIYIILLMAITAATMTKAMCQTDIYKQYKHLTDVKVICIMKFPINDTTTTAITLFVPKTKEAVYYLAEEFNLGIEKDIIDDTFGDENNSKILRFIVHRDNVKKKFGYYDSDDYMNISRLVYRYATGVLLIIHNIETEERDIAISKFLTGTLTEPEKFPSIDNANNK